MIPHKWHEYWITFTIFYLFSKSIYNNRKRKESVYSDRLIVIAAVHDLQSNLLKKDSTYFDVKEPAKTDRGGR